MRFFLYFLMLSSAPALAADTDAAPAGIAQIYFPTWLGRQTSRLPHRPSLPPRAMPSRRRRKKARALRAAPATQPAGSACQLLPVAPRPGKRRPAGSGRLSFPPDDSSVIDKLRIEWLKILGKRQQWDLFDAEFPKLVGIDLELTCYSLLSRSRGNYLLALRDARALWFDGATLPESCGTLFESARSVGIINEPDIRQRLRLAMEGNNVTLAAYLAGLLKETAIALPGELRKAASDPDRYLRNFPASGASGDQRFIAQFALHRLAKQNPELALARWDRISAQFPAKSGSIFSAGWAMKPRATWIAAHWNGTRLPATRYSTNGNWNGGYARPCAH